MTPTPEPAPPSWMRLPRGIMLRGLLILAAPMLLTQVVAGYIFYSRHWTSVSRHMEHALSGETAYLADVIGRVPPWQAEAEMHRFERATGMRVNLSEHGVIPTPAPAEEELSSLSEQVRASTGSKAAAYLNEDEQEVRIYVKTPQGLLELAATDKRVINSSTNIFLGWMIGSALFFVGVAGLFLRNQLKPIRDLAFAAERFGKGKDTLDYRPRGAAEVRLAGRAFLQMRERLKRQMQTRTQMLAGISHDLRTPLTRMRLQLGMLPPQEATDGLKRDIAQMERMVQEYLDFARGSGGEEAQEQVLCEFVEALVAEYAAESQPVAFVQRPKEDAVLEFRPLAITRMLRNVLENALKHAKRVEVSVLYRAKEVLILVDDNGPGIPQAHREEVFKPFTTLVGGEEIKLSASQSVGLGLTIARDIVLQHGGTIELLDSPLGGLRVQITLPR